MSRIPVIMAALLLHLVCAAGAQEGSEFERLPVWPADGKLSHSLQTRYVFRDPVTKEIVIAVPPEFDAPSSGPRRIYRYRPQNQVGPEFTVRISGNPGDGFEYGYVLANRKDAVQSIGAWWLMLPGPGSDVQVEPGKWLGVRLTHTVLTQDVDLGQSRGDVAYFSAHADGVEEVAPGGSAGGFLLRSKYLPGFTTAYVQGGEPLNTPGDLPLEAARQLTPLMSLRENNRLVITLGPRFVPEAEKRDIASDFKRGINLLIKRGLLSADSTFCRSIKATLSACESGADTCRADSILIESNNAIESQILAALRLALRWQRPR